MVLVHGMSRQVNSIELSCISLSLRSDPCTHSYTTLCACVYTFKMSYVKLSISCIVREISRAKLSDSSTK